MKYELKEHSYRKDGKHLILENGDMWSIIDLGASTSNDPVAIKAMQEVGEMYDKMGGRFEGAKIVGDAVDGDSLLRGHSIDEVVNSILESLCPQ